MASPLALSRPALHPALVVVHVPGCYKLCSHSLCLPTPQRAAHRALVAVRSLQQKSQSSLKMHRCTLVARCRSVTATAQVSPPRQVESAKTIYQRLGGQPAVLVAVELVYQKLLADPRLQHFFDGVDMAKLTKHQVEFVTLALDGCKENQAPRIAAAHAHLIRERGLTVGHFDMVLQHFRDALAELDAALHELAEPSDLVGVADDVMATFESLRPAFAPPAGMLPEAQATHA